MGAVVQHHVHDHSGRSLDDHILSILKRVVKSLSRPQTYLTVVFVGETHNTVDERRRTALFGNRPSSGDLLTVVERAMGMPASGPHLIVEAPMEQTRLGPFDEKRDDSVINQIGIEMGKHAYKVVLILFGEDHERKFLQKVAGNAAIPAMEWHSYRSFHDHTPTQSFLPYDPRSSGYSLAGMINMTGMNEIDLAQLAEGLMPRANSIPLSILNPFFKQAPSKYAFFVRGPLIGQLQSQLRMKSNLYVQVTADSLPSMKVLNVEGKVRPVPSDFMNDVSRARLVEEFWQDAAD